MLMKTAAMAATFVLAACGYESRYEELVYDYDPVYCYQSIGAVQCYKQPKHSDERRLVNYYGPAPSRYDRDDDPDTPELQAPAEIDHWYKDPEPVVGAAPVAETAAPQAQAPQTPAAQSKAAASGDVGVPELTLWERLRRGVFGKPQLANKPKAAAQTSTL